MDKIATTEPSPDLKPASDGLFGDGKSIEDVCDVSSRLLTALLAKDVNFFHLPLLEQLHRRPYHMVKLRGEFAMAKLLRDHQSQLLRSESCLTPNGKNHIERLMFCLGQGVFAVYDATELMVYAPTREAAADAAARMKRYRKREREKVGFRLISLSNGYPSTELIAIQEAAPVNAQELALHYGEDFLDWERTWLERLRQRRSGVSILFGPPGCGKTSYLRSMMARLVRTFEFCYVPVSAFDVLTNPSLVSFWVEQRGDGRGKRRIAIMEDAEELLLPRDEGSRARVSNLLNIGDGFLGEHLKLHVVATTNAPIRQLDPAMLRPGRLMGTREFRRLTRPEAQRFAEAKGLTLADQPDYSLGELYCGGVTGPALNVDRQIGFTL